MVVGTLRNDDTCPIGGASTTTRSQRDRVDSKTTFPIMAVSRTPGTVSTTAAKMRLTAASRGTRIRMRRYSSSGGRIHDRGVHIAESLRLRPKTPARRWRASPLRSIARASTRRPLLAAATASEAATALLPVPPLPVTITNRRFSTRSRVGRHPPSLAHSLRGGTRGRIRHRRIPGAVPRRAAAVKERGVPPLEGEARRRFLASAQQDFIDYSLIADAEVTIEGIVWCCGSRWQG